jgi:hypothetical protein
MCRVTVLAVALINENLAKTMRFHKILRLQQWNSISNTRKHGVNNQLRPSVARHASLNHHYCKITKRGVLESGTQALSYCTVLYKYCKIRRRNGMDAAFSSKLTF